MNKSDSMPVVTLEMRIAPMVRQMVQHMLLSESETSALITDAAEAAIKNFDYKRALSGGAGI